jgi:hypothetical protein
MTRAIVMLVIAVAIAAQAAVSGVREPVRSRRAMVIAQQPADEAGIAVVLDSGVRPGFPIRQSLGDQR